MHSRRKCGVLESLQLEIGLSTALLHVHSSSLVRHHVLRPLSTQALVSLITAFATSSISSALSFRNGRGRSSSESTTLSPSRTSLPRGVLRWVSAGASYGGVRGVQTALARLFRVDGHRDGGLLRSTQSDNSWCVCLPAARAAQATAHLEESLELDSPSLERVSRFARLDDHL